MKICLAVLALCWVHSAHAGFVTETATVSGLTDYNKTLSVAKFDGSLGTLKDVVVSYTDQAAITNGMLTNTSRGPEDFTVTQTMNFSLVYGNQSILTNTFIESESYTNLAVGIATAFGPFSPTGQAGPYTYTTQLTQFVGPGNLDFNFSAMTNTKVTGFGGNEIFTEMTTAGATMTVRYDYLDGLSSVPEPSSIALVLTGMVLIAVRYKR